MANKTAEPVYISFNKLDHLLEVKGRKWQFLRDSGISPGIVAKMKDGSGIPIHEPYRKYACY